MYDRKWDFPVPHSAMNQPRCNRLTSFKSDQLLKHSVSDGFVSYRQLFDVFARDDPRTKPTYRGLRILQTYHSREGRLDS